MQEEEEAAESAFRKAAFDALAAGMTVRTMQAALDRLGQDLTGFSSQGVREAGRTQARPRHRMTDARRQEVATVYRKAFVDGLPPTQAVADHFDVSHTTAARWVRCARASGNLGPSVGPQAGEAA